jgi:hypothetical protein
MTVQHQQSPEARGPGIPHDDGSVEYGPTAQARDYPQVVIESLRDPEERQREQAATPFRCSFCADIPVPLLNMIAEALREARKKAPR